MTQYEDDLESVQSVPQPLEHWYGAPKIDADNEILLGRKKVYRRFQTAPSWVFWAKDELKRAEQSLETFNTKLETTGVNTMLEALAELETEAESIKVQMFNTKQEYTRSQEPEKCEELREKGKILLTNMQGVQADRKALLRKLKPHRQLIQSRDNLAARIQEHYAAIAEEREETVRTRDMDKEARLIGERIILALNKLGFRHRRTKRDFMGHVVEVDEMVRFERIIATPDKVIFKLDVSRLGLLGGHVDNLPYGVYAQDLVNERVLTHLNIAVQLPVSSPNMTGEADWYKGVWFVVDRLGIPDGLEEKVLYGTVMKRYPVAKGGLMPVPLGVKAGRKINWVFLAKEPHVMINGVTGYGKSNAFQMLIATLIAKHSPDEIKLIIADMKDSGDFSHFKGLPHMLAFASELDKAEEVSISLYLEMKRRQAIISKITNNIGKYNSLVADEDKLAHIFFVFDEYPSINIDKKLAAVIHRHIALIAMQGRSAGIHLVVSGQQSYANDFPRTMLSNITCQFTARQNTVSGAQATTGTRETMRLKEIAGRFLYTSSHSRYQVQMPYIEDDEIEAACAMARRWPEPRPFALPIVERNEDEYTVDARIDPESLILDVAFKKFDGALKARPIWEQIKDEISLPQTTKIVKELAERESIEWDDKNYEAIKQKGNFYRLFEIEEDPETEPFSA